MTKNLSKQSLTWIEDFERDGYAIIRNAFTQEEVAQFRAAIDKLKVENEKKGIRVPQDPLVPELMWYWGDLLSQKGLDKIIFDERVLSTARAILGNEIVYWGDSTFNIGRGYRGFHKDSVDRANPEGADWKSYYDVIRMGIYLQDHSRHSGGVKMRKGSHRFPDLKTGEIVDVPSQPGDLLVWKLTTTHSGNALRCKFLPNTPLENRWERRLPEFLALPEEKERNTVLLTFARPGFHFERYMKWCVDRGDYHELWRHSRYDAEIQATCEAKGIRFVKPIPDYGSKYRA